MGRKPANMPSKMQRDRTAPQPTKSKRDEATRPVAHKHSVRPGFPPQSSLIFKKSFTPCFPSIASRRMPRRLRFQSRPLPLGTSCGTYDPTWSGTTQCPRVVPEFKPKTAGTDKMHALLELGHPASEATDAKRPLCPALGRSQHTEPNLVKIC